MAIINNFLTLFDCLIITTITTALWIIVKHYYDNRRIFELGSKLPGPKPLPFIGNVWHFLGYKYDMIKKLKRYQGKDKLLAIWFGHELNVYLYSPEYAEILCHSPKLLERTGKARFIAPATPKGLLVTNGQEWKKARVIMENAMPYSALKNFIPVFEAQSEILVQRLREKIGKPCFPITPYIKACSFDIISDISLEFELKAQKSEIALLKEIDMIVELVNRRVFNVFYYPDFLYRLVPEGIKFYSILESAVNYTIGVILERKKKHEEKKSRKGDENLQESKRKILCETLLDDESLSVSDIKDHVFTMVAGGYETSSTTVVSALKMLALHPDVQEKTYQEVISVIDGGFNDEKIHQLEYLDMVIKETLRLFPSAPFTFRKATEDVQMGEYVIPAGADVNVNIYELHRDPEQFDNPHRFNPDNFLPENVAKRHPFAYIPFAGGKRKCVGARLAILVVKVVVAKLILSYKFECDHKDIEDIKFQGNVTIQWDDNGLIRILERK